MKLHPLLAVAAICGALSPLCANAAPPHWEYGGEHGVAHWAQLDPSYEACGIGHKQSPIDIRNAVPAPLPALQFSYGRVQPSIVNNGHTIQVNVPKGQTLVVEGRAYELVQFHFHTPSEEKVNGKAFPMVAHFVHRDADGKLAVVAALLQAGKGGSGLDAVLSHLPSRAGETLSVEGLEIDLAGMLPADHRYYDFEGSLTTPPCSEGVHWMVLKQPVSVSAQSIKAFRAVYAANARPVQPLNGRVVRVSQN